MVSILTHTLVSQKQGASDLVLSLSWDFTRVCIGLMSAGACHKLGVVSFSFTHSRKRGYKSVAASLMVRAQSVLANICG